LPGLNDFLEKNGIAHSDKVICFPDYTPNGSLYLLNRSGWTAYNGSYPSINQVEMKKRIEAGARYLVLSDYNPLVNPVIYSHVKKFTGSFHDISFYELDSDTSFSRGFISIICGRSIINRLPGKECREII